MTPAFVTMAPMEPVSGYPLLLDVTGRRVLVVGAGTVGTRRARGLVEAGADVVVVAPDVADLPDGVTVHRRRFELSDLDEAWLVHACTSDPDVNAAVATAAADR